MVLKMFTFYISFQESKNFSKWESTIKVECLEEEVENKVKELYETSKKFYPNKKYAFIGTEVNGTFDNIENVILDYQATMNFNEENPTLARWKDYWVHYNF